MKRFLFLLMACISGILSHAQSVVAYVEIDGIYAIHGCKSLKNVMIPANVRHIGVEAFGICDALENLTVETGNLVYDSREDCNAIIETATNTIVQGTTHTIIPESVTIIGENSFYDYNIKEFTIPANIERIETNALRFNYPGEGKKISYISMRPTPPSIQQNSLF